MDGQVGSWVRAALEEANYGREKVQKITNILKSEDVMGNALLMLTLNDMKDMNINMGPRKVLANRIAAVSQPTAKAGCFGTFWGQALSRPDRNLAGSPR